MVQTATELSFSDELIVAISLLYCVAFIVFLAICICGCRKGSPKPTGGSNPHRSLPDIPVYAEGDIPCIDNGVSGDTSSDLYATVEDKVTSGLRHSLPNGVHSQVLDSSIKHSHNYARVKENPYDKVKKTENPYAKVQSNDDNEEISRDSTPSTSHPSTSLADPIAPPRSRRSSLQNLVVTSPGNPSSTGDIPAATAVAGGVAASQDLPYMTPPISQIDDDGVQIHFSGDSQDSSKGYTSISVREPLEHIRNQTKAMRSRKEDVDPHYATVSDDSDDNMYAAIVEPKDQIYNGSETYAQIQPITIVEVHGQQSNSANSVDRSDETDVPAPELPNVNMKHVTVHSRQASSSSCTSSIANLGSPKPEKRQANSPLPPTPAVSPDVYSRVEKNHSRENSRSNINVSRNLEDMYAKVQKTKKKEDTVHTSSNDVNSHNNRSYTPDIAPYQKIRLENRQSWSSKDSYDEHKQDVYEQSSDSDSDMKKRELEEHCYETLSKTAKKLSPRKSDISEIGYEKIRLGKPSTSQLLDTHEIGYEKIRERKWSTGKLDSNEIDYQKFRDRKWSTDSNSPKTDLVEIGYEKIGDRKWSTEANTKSGPESFLSNDPGYEELSISRVSSETDPNYEILRPQGSSDIYSSIKTNKSTLTTKDIVPTNDGYSVVNKLRKNKSDPGYEELNNDFTEEPNYESMPSECGNYTTVHQKSTESESDPNYESVKYLDVALNEPPYEKFDNNSDLSEYEPISSKNNSNTPDYERIKEIGSKSSDNSEDRTISSDSKFSNGTDEEDFKNKGAQYFLLRLGPERT